MKSTLLSFYAGDVSASVRLEIERQMLTDPEVLLDFFEIKREAERAECVPQVTSPQVWQRLHAHLPKSRRARWTWALSLGLAAALALLLFSKNQSVSKAHVGKSTLFDSSSEQFGHANVL
jgi:hypothetical protein